MDLGKRLAVLGDPKAMAALQSLHRQHAGQAFGIVLSLLPQLHRMVLGRALDWSRIEHRLRAQPLAVDAESGIFLYLLARACGARSMVELGSSTGVSTIYLALAARENGGSVIATELVPEKMARAQENVRAAGLESYVDFRLGDALDTLSRPETEVDFFHNDGFPRFALPVLQLLAPRMRPSAVTLCGNAALFPADHADYLAWVRDPRNGFLSSPLPMKLGGEVSLRVGPPGGGLGSRADARASC